MPARVFLHVGPPKTATTYLQSHLTHNADALAGLGVAVLGTQTELREAASELLGRGPRPGAEPRPGAWQELRERVAATEGDVVLSCERFSLLLEHHARALLQDVGGTEVHVVLTYRDGTAHLVSRWQERVKNGGTESWAEFCDRIAADSGFRDRMLRMRPPLEAWTAVLPPEQVHVITVPPAGSRRELVLERFCEVLGIPASSMHPSPSLAHNPSLGAAEAELVRLLNARAKGVLSPAARRAEVRDFLTGAALLARPADARLQPTHTAFDAARADTARLVEQVHAAGLPVHGDLDELLAVGRPERPQTSVGDEAVLAAAVQALAAMTKRAHEARHQVPEPPAPSWLHRLSTRVCPRDDGGIPRAHRGLRGSRVGAREPGGKD
jgi:hypothetical protein